MSGLPSQHAHSLPAINANNNINTQSNNNGGGSLPATISSSRQLNAVAPLSKRTKYSLNAESRNPDSMRRARRYVDQLAGGTTSSAAAATTTAATTAQSYPMPAQPTASPTMTGQGAFHLSPAESYVAAQKEATAERWRSSLLHYEADMRELVVSNSTSLGEEPPTCGRIIRTLKIFDGVGRACEELSPHLAEMLRLFRIEFCRAIFSNVLSLNIDGDDDDDDDEDDLSGEADAGYDYGGIGGGGKGRGVMAPSRAARALLADPAVLEKISEDEVTTYFDQVGTLVRENALLTSEVAVGNSRARMVELSREIELLNEKIAIYENEVGRLARQSDQVMEQCNRARDELVEANRKHEVQVASNEKELQALNVENKDLQLQLFRLRKQVAGGKTKHLKNTYKQMKNDKMQMLTTLFSEGDERMATLVMMSQLESRVNEVLDRYDNDFMLTPAVGQMELRKTMGETVMCVLEEMHMCERNYHRLVPDREHHPATEETDETDGYVAMLFDQKIYQNLLAREAIKQRLQHGAEMLAQQENRSVVGGGGERLFSLRSGIPSVLESVAMCGQSPIVDLLSPSQGSYVLQQPACSGSEDIPQPPQQQTQQPHLHQTPKMQNQNQNSAQLNDTFFKSSFVAHGLSLPDQSVPAMLPRPGVVAGGTSSQGRTSFALTSSGCDRHNGDDGEAPDLEEIVFLKRAEWIERIFSVTLQEQLLRDVHVYLSSHAHSQRLKAAVLMPRLVRHPLYDLSGKKFLSRIDVFCGCDPVQQRRLCTINYVDPAIPIQLPESVNYMKIKYRSSYAPPATTGNFTAIEDGRSGAQPIPGAESLTSPFMAKSVSTDASSTGVFMTATGELSRFTTKGEAPPPQPQQSAAGRRSVRGQGGPSSYASAAAAAAVAAAATAANASSGAANVSKRLKEWGPKTEYVEEQPHSNGLGLSDIATTHVAVVGRGGGGGYVSGTGRGTGSLSTAGGGADNPEDCDVFQVNENLRVFRELTNPSLMKSGRSDQQKAGATSSTTATTVAFQRLNPLSPNRGPEWAVYKSLFGSFRSLTPRMIEVTTIDHILMSACERHFTRMEYRYEACLKEAGIRGTNSQMALAMAERFFRESYDLTDFQEVLVDELEARYCFPELVSKTMYEILCYLDAMAHKDELLALYLNVIRGFQPPTHLHYISYMLFHLSYCWPTSDPTEEISRDDALTVLRYLYRNADNIVHVDIHEVLRDYIMTTRSAPMTFVAMRKFMAAAMMHQEESLLLYLHGLFSSHCECESLDQLTHENYEAVVSRHWQDRADQKSTVRFLATGLGLDRGPLLNVRDLAAIASSEWASNLWC